MKLSISLFPALCLALAACGQEPAPAPEPTQTPAEKPIVAPPAPTKEIFSALYSKACPKAKPVNEVLCKRAGLGSTEVLCEYSLGDDEYLRNKTTIVADGEAWTLSDPENTCTAD